MAWDLLLLRIVSTLFPYHLFQVTRDFPNVFSVDTMEMYCEFLSVNTLLYSMSKLEQKIESLTESFDSGHLRKVQTSQETLLLKCYFVQKHRQKKQGSK